MPLNVRPSLLLGLALFVAAVPLLPLVRHLPSELKDDDSVGDLAIIELSIIEASHGERLVGQAARFGFYQLGPSHFYLQAPLYRLFDSQRFTLSLTCLLVNWAALLGVLYALGRWWDTAAALFIFPLVAVPWFGYYESATLFNYWGQYLIVLPSALFLLTAAAVVCGRTAAWPLLLALGSFLVQGYGSTLLPVAAVLMVALVQTIRRPRHRPGVILALSLLVLACFWWGTVVDELTRSPGNLSLMWSHYSSSAPRSVPPMSAVFASLAKHIAAPVLHSLWQMTVNSPLEGERLRLAELVAAAQVLLLAVCAGLAARRRQAYSAVLCGLCLLILATAVVAARMSDGDIYPYVFFWLSACAAIGWVAAGAVLLSAVTAFAERRREAWLLALAAGLALALPLRPIAIPRLGDSSVSAFSDALQRHLEAKRPVRLVSHDFAWPWALGMLIQLDHQGRLVSMANVQGTTEIPHFQGLGEKWLRPVPGSVEVHLFDRDPGAVEGLERLLCHPVLPLDATKPVMCLYVRNTEGESHVRMDRAVDPAEP